MSENLPENPEEEKPEGKKQKPPPRKRRARKPSPRPDPGYFDEELERSSKGLRDTFHNALEAHLASTVEQKKKELKNLKALDNLLSQYLDSFIVIGYDTTGEYVSLVSAHNEQSADSLSTGLHKFIMNNIRGGNQMPPFV